MEEFSRGRTCVLLLKPMKTCKNSRADVFLKKKIESDFVNYSGDLNSKIFWYLNGQKQFVRQMNGPIFNPCFE